VPGVMALASALGCGSSRVAPAAGGFAARASRPAFRGRLPASASLGSKPQWLNGIRWWLRAAAMQTKGEVDASHCPDSVDGSSPDTERDP
jgi:hypothetical protein